MRMNSQQRFRTTRTRRNVFFAVAVACIGVFFFSGPLSFLTSYVIAPLSVVRVWLVTSDSMIPFYFRSRAALQQENEELRERLVRAHVDELYVRILAEEKKLFPMASSANSSRIVANIVRRPYETPYDSLVVDQGSADGIVEGALVYGNGAVIGTVGRVLPGSAFVVLFSTAGVKSPMYIYGANIFVHGTGMGGGVVRLGVPQGVPVSLRDPVVIPTTPSAVFGLVENLEVDPSKPEQYAYVTMQPPINTLRFVAIDTKALEPISFEEAERMVAYTKSHYLQGTSSIGTLIESLPIASTTASTTAEAP